MSSELSEKRQAAFKEFAEKCKEALFIYDVVAPVIDLKKRGSTYVGLCPFHNEKTPSFTINTVKNYYNCFGCGSKGDAVKFVMDYNDLDFKDAIESIGRHYNIEKPQILGEAKTDNAPKIRVKEPEKEPVLIPMETVQKTLKLYGNNHFAQFLIQIFGTSAAMDLIQRFKIGTSKKWNGSSIFWYWNDKGATAGKIMLYDPKTGKRDKSKNGSVFHEMKLEKPKNGFYGDWQLEGNDKTVMIVESEKTAICMSAISPKFCWIATGGKSNLDFAKDSHDVLLGQKIVLCPDVDGFDKWKEHCEIGNESGFDVSIYEGLMKLNLCENDDVLDVALREKWHIPNNISIETPKNTMGNIWSNAFEGLVMIAVEPKKESYDLTVNDRINGNCPF